MADMNKRGPADCDDGEGERGERGKRGKRGKRGHRGHDGERGERGHDGEVGATGPTGPAALFLDLTPPTLTGNGSEQAPLQVINVAAQPHTSPTEERIIFANATGNDETGDGTEARPYRTFQRAALDVPLFIPSGVRYTINLTGLGDEVLPPEYEFPTWQAADFIFPGNAITIIADFKPAAILSPSARVFTPTSTSQNPVSLTWSVEDVSQSWPDLRGFFVTWNGGEFVGVIHESSGTILQIAGDEEPFGEISIVEPSARLLVADVDIRCDASLLIQGLAFEPASPETGSLTISNSMTWIERCTIVGAFFAAPVYRQYTFYCNLVACSWSGPFYVHGCRVTDLSAEAFEAPPYMIFKSGTVIENGETITPVNLDPAWRFGANLLLDSVLVKNCLSDGFFWPGGVGVINNVEVNNCGGHAFHFRGPGKYTLTNVGGSSNAGVGVRVDDGAQVELVQPVTVTGAVGDQEVGNLGPNAYPAAPFNINDIGVPGTSAGGATGTNARLYSNG